MSAARSLTGKRWREPSSVLGAEDLTSFAQTLMQARGLSETNDADHWSTDAQYPDARKAAERTEKAMRDGETIGIFGDYDADGITATALLVRLFVRRTGVAPFVRL